MLIQNISGSTPAMPMTGRVNVDNTPSVVPTPAPHTQLSAGQLQNAVDIINHAMHQSHQNLEFSVDSATKTPVVKMTDSSTGQVISQFPSEAALAIAHSIDQMQPGLLLKQKA